MDLDLDSTLDQTSFFSDRKDAKNISYFFLKKFNFLLKFCVKILFCKHYFSPLSTFMGKGKDPDAYLLLMDPDRDTTPFSRYFKDAKKNFHIFF